MPFSLWLFFFNDTATTEIYTLSLHDALPICPGRHKGFEYSRTRNPTRDALEGCRSEEHTSELQSRPHLVCRLLLEKQKRISCHKAASNWRSHHPQVTNRITSL